MFAEVWCGVDFLETGGVGYVTRLHKSFRESERGDEIGGVFLENKMIKAGEKVNEKIEEIARKRERAWLLLPSRGV